MHLSTVRVLLDFYQQHQKYLLVVNMSSLPKNVHVSNHPCLRAKLSKLRSNLTNAKDFKSLVHEISLIVGCEALATGLSVASETTVSS